MSEQETLEDALFWRWNRKTDELTPITLEGGYKGRFEDQHIGDETINGTRISTIFLALDHGWGGAPLFFETMIFGGKYDQFCERYATAQEAREGHARVVNCVRENRDPNIIEQVEEANAKP